MYDMYPADWPAVDGRERTARRRRARRDPARTQERADAATTTVNAGTRRDHRGEPRQ